MNQTLAIFLDAYRDLNSRKMFWITLVLSGLVVLAFLLVGVNAHGVKILVWQLDSPDMDSPAAFYKRLLMVAVDVWLSWVAVGLALISTSTIFPEFISGGSIELFLCKPIGRLRLFLTKYLSGLLFATLQVAVFCAACFLVMGIRGGMWEPKIFLAVPLVVAVFSYLYCVSVRIGVWTRSTVAAVLLTLLFWLAVGMVNFTENGLLMTSLAVQRQDRMLQQSIAFCQRSLDDLPSAVNSVPGVEQTRRSLQARLEQFQTQRAQLGSGWTEAHRFVFEAKTLLPKTSETTDLLHREFLSITEELPGQDEPDTPFSSDSVMDWIQSLSVQRDFEREIRSRSVAWVLGTSFAFEIMILIPAAWLFCRRDY
jgi:ABC-type transport system involved in multi-copper enzyme maturation permease subunit